MSTNTDTTPESATPSTDGGPRAWRDRTTYRALDELVRASVDGQTTDPDHLAAVTTEARPSDPTGYGRDLAAVTKEAVKLWESGSRGPARDLLRTRAGELDEKYGTADAQRDRALEARDQRQAARSAELDPEALAADVPDYSMHRP